MFDLILDTARRDARIRAVILQGSRANPNAPRDPFQDFDIVYVVTEVAPFRHNLDWIQRFGALMIVQMPDAMGDPPPDNADGFIYLMQFVDGNRIDLSIVPAARLAAVVEDSQSVVLLDKDGIVPSLPPASDRGYRPQPPTEKAFADCCNEFWWVCPYVAKGLWRGEITYAKQMQECVVRDQLMQMLSWMIGVATGFAVSPGKFGKYLPRYLSAEEWALLLRTYAGADAARTWEALFAMGDLFRLAALRVAAHFGYAYPHDDDARVSAHLRHVRWLPRDAPQVY